MKRVSVKNDSEFRRVASLPRRVLTEQAAAEAAAMLTPRFTLYGSKAKLNPWQGIALKEAIEVQGLVAWFPVGLGKTLMTWLLPTALESKAWVLILPAAHITTGKVHADFEALSRDWVTPRVPPTFVSRELLSQEGSYDLLERLAPDLIMIDESDELQNYRSATAARVDRYKRSHNPRVATLTATPIRHSVMGIWQSLFWAFGEGSPLPLDHGVAQMWAAALDPRDKRGFAVMPGPLGSTPRNAREWMRRRFAETPGLVVVDGDSCSAPLRFRLRLAKEDPVLDAHYDHFLERGETPGGVPVSDPLSRWLLDGQLGLGLYGRWNPPPPEEWREARRQVARFIRDAIDRSRRTSTPLDTEAQVIRRHGSHPIVARWLDVRERFDDHKTEVVWVSHSAIESALAWLAEDSSPAIVWSGCVPFGEALARAARLPYYGRKGLTEDGSSLLFADPKRSLVASWGANKKGFNLQPWRRHLICMPPQSAKWLEQIVGRAHRQGQTEPVTIDILVTSGGTFDLFDAALLEAQGSRSIVSMSQKVERATIERERPRKTRSNEARWAVREKRSRTSRDDRRSRS